MKSLLDHLQCTVCCRRYSADELRTICPDCGKVLFARYDLDAGRGLSPRALEGRPWTMWRYGELLPVRQEANIVTLGEGMTRCCGPHAWGVLTGSNNFSSRKRG